MRKCSKDVQYRRFGIVKEFMADDFVIPKSVLRNSTHSRTVSDQIESVKSGNNPHFRFVFLYFEKIVNPIAKRILFGAKPTQLLFL